MQCNKMHDQK